MAKLISSDGSQLSHGKGTISTGHFSNTNGNKGIANGRNNTIRVGYDGYVPARSKSTGKGGNKVATKSFGAERSDD